MGLFKKKPGGSLFGNLLRSVVNNVSGGMLGTGAKRIEIGQTQTNEQLSGMGMSPNISVLQQPDNSPNLSTLITGLNKTLNSGMQQNVAVEPKSMIMIGAVVVLVLFLINKRK